MTEPAAKPRLALVDRVLAEDAVQTSDTQKAAERKVLAKHAPVMARMVRAEANAEHEAAMANAAARHTGQIAGMSEAHGAELGRYKTLVGKAALEQGRIQGVWIGAGMVAAIVIGVFLLLKDVVILNTATQRVNYPRPPAIEDSYAAPNYPRSPREPRDAQ